MTETSSITYLNKCLCCGSENLTMVLDLHDQPLANSYVKDINDVEEYYPLALNYCNDCTHLQLTHGVNPDLLFKNYLYVSGTTQTLRDYFDEFVNISSSYMPVKGPYKILDIACNDGSQLDAFKKQGHQTYGVDPAVNLHEISSKNHTVICDYFNESSVVRLGADRYDVIVAQNVFAHNTYPKDFLTVCKDRLSHTGRLFIQTSQADMVMYGQFDTIYHEHISFFNVKSMATLAKQAGMYLQDVFKTSIHGTSYVFVLTTDPSHDTSTLLIENEAKQTIDVAKKFATTAVRVVTELKDELNRYTDCLLVGYGAAAKGNTLLNFGEIDLDYIVDDNPLKQGLYTPGRKIKIVSLDDLVKLAGSKPIVWVPLSWNFFNEIRERIKNKYHEPTVFIKYFPNMQVILDENEE